jgi:hypothetical protein
VKPSSIFYSKTVRANWYSLYCRNGNKPENGSVLTTVNYKARLKESIVEHLVCEMLKPMNVADMGIDGILLSIIKADDE